MEQRISKTENRKVYISDMFDLNAGTSIGGIVSLGYNIFENGKPKFDSEFFLDLFCNKGD